MLAFLVKVIFFGHRVSIVVGRRRRFSCKIQNSKYGRGSGQISNFEFCGVGSQSSSVAVVAFLAKFKIQILAAGSGHI